MINDVTISPAMLVFLDNLWNEKDQLNENYARELMELFTMGLYGPDGSENYTQEDVRDVAYALCGWRYQRYASPPLLPPYFAWYYFDYVTERTPLGAPPGIYGLLASQDKDIPHDIIDALFEQRADAIAHYIARKIYRHFIHRDADSVTAKEVVNEMAATFKIDWELKPMIERLLRSKHFFDPALRGAIVKSPYDWMLGMANHLNIEIDQFRAGCLGYRGWEMGQFLLNPINVKGWPGHRTWLTSGTLMKRIEFLNDLVIKGEVTNDYEWILWPAEDVIAWSEQFPSHRSDFTQLTTEISEVLFAIEPDANQLAEVIKQVQSFPDYEWPAMSDEVRVPILRRLLQKLMMLPEYQLS